MLTNAILATVLALSGGGGGTVGPIWCSTDGGGGSTGVGGGISADRPEGGDGGGYAPQPRP